MIGSDGLPTLHGKPHPRLYGTFARVLGTYARDEHVLPLETAVHRMTGFPARKFGLADRGEVRPGAFADLVVFDPARDRGHRHLCRPASSARRDRARIRERRAGRARRRAHRARVRAAHCDDVAALALGRAHAARRHAAGDAQRTVATARRAGVAGAHRVVALRVQPAVLGGAGAGTRARARRAATLGRRSSYGRRWVR